MPRLLLVSLLLLASAAHANLSARGEAGIETRLFEGDGNGATKDFNLGAYGRAILKHRRGPMRTQLRLFGRTGALDPDRNRLNVEEAWTGFRRSGWKLRLGARMLNWTATEAFHPADIINSRNYDSDIENAEKLGEPMLSISRKIARGSLTAYYLPYLTAPQLPSGSSRVGFLGPGARVGRAFWAQAGGELSRKHFAHQGAVRLTQTFGPADVSLHAVRHLDRDQPVFKADPADGKIHPVFLPVTQLGGTYLHVLGPWVAKLEAAWRDFASIDAPTRLGPLEVKDHGIIAFGLEYGWNNRGGSDSTILFEGQGIAGRPKAERAALHIFQRDLLIGYRHAFNDTLSRELLFTFLFDVERSTEYLFNASYRRRLSDTLSLKTGARWVQACVKGAVPAGLEGLRAADQVYLTLTRHF